MGEVDVVKKKKKWGREGVERRSRAERRRVTMSSGESEKARVRFPIQGQVFYVSVTPSHWNTTSPMSLYHWGAHSHVACSRYVDTLCAVEPVAVIIKKGFGEATRRPRGRAHRGVRHALVAVAMAIEENSLTSYLWFPPLLSPALSPTWFCFQSLLFPRP